MPTAPRALAAIVWAGEAPVGLMLVRDGSLVVVADSNRFRTAGRALADLSVLNVATALAAAIDDNAVIDGMDDYCLDEVPGTRG
jgi:hypothetical protein